MTPDTLLYEGYYALDTLLAADSLLFRPLPADARTEAWGFGGQLMPAEALHRNDGVTLALLATMLVLTLVVATSRRRLGEQVEAFFYPSRNDASPQEGDTANAELIHGLLCIMASLLVSLLFYSYAQTRWNLTLALLTPLELLGIYAGITLAFFLARQLLFGFVHRVFFTSAQRHVWLQGQHLVCAIECLLLLPLALVTVYFRLPPLTTAYALAGVLLFVKSMALFKSISTFFPNIHGILHLFVYFCTLELSPILVLWTTMLALTDYLTTHY